MISKAKIKYIQQLGQKKYRRAEEAFVAEGPKIVGDLMAVTPPLMVVATEEWAAMHHTSLPHNSHRRRAETYLFPTASAESHGCLQDGLPWA